MEDSDRLIGEMASAFQESVVDVLVYKTLEAADMVGAKGVILGGGVAANALLRQEMVRQSSLPALIPPPVLCTDNGAMIAASGYYHYTRGRGDSLDLDVDPGLSL